jgi:hypothetical protein
MRNPKIRMVHQIKRLFVDGLIDKGQGSGIERLAFDQPQFVHGRPVREEALCSPR